jgi:hypothetical protein
VQDAQGLIESSKFEPGASKVDEAEKLMGEAQIAFILLLALARQRPGIALPDAVRAAAQELDNAVATALLAMETQVVSGSQPAVLGLEDAMDALGRSVDASTSALGGPAADSYPSQLLALYRSLVEAIKRLSSMGDPHYGEEVLNRRS